MSLIKKAIIPAAGLGTRFLPATKSVPKEMLNIVDQPIILYVVEEAVKSGIEDIIFISGHGKVAIEDFFDCSYELEDKLLKDNKEELLTRIQEISKIANIISIRQKKPLGLGHAVLCGQSLIGSEPFAVLLGDEIMINKPHQPPVINHLISQYKKHNLSCIAIMEVLQSDVQKYGIVSGIEIEKGLFRVEKVVEKPAPTQTTSRLAIPGRYLFTSHIFEYLKKIKPGKGGELQLTDAIDEMAQNEGLLASTFEAKRFDAGDKLGYIQANIELALEHKEIGHDIKQYIKHLAKSL